MTTNENKSVERKFILKIHNPIATIKTTGEEWYMWEKFTFTANPTWSNSNLTYAWKIIDIKNDTEIVNKNSSTFTHTFTEKWKYNVKLFVTDASWDTDVDYKIIHINSRAPQAKFAYKIPYSNKPNTVFLDASSSFDADFSDDWKLVFSWIINWERVNLENPNYNWSNWYYTFSSIGDQSVVLEVTDPDDMTSQTTQKISIKSILSVEFFALPRVVQREKPVRFVADSPEASFYEWDFGDWYKEWWKNDGITHNYSKSWVYNVKLKVIDDNDNINTFSKNVYIWDTDEPFAFITLKDSKANNISFDSTSCNWDWAYIVNRMDTFTFSWEESLDVTWEHKGLSYSWKIWNNIYSSESFAKKFDELWCSKVKLTVKSNKNWKESTQEINIKTENLKPILSNLDIRVKDSESDPVLVTLNAIWAKDLDWVIQSYLWYYYTDIDPEPQDFRATKTSTTTFVLPKVTWNYYFVVVMKDNNEARSNSEELSGSKYFITLTGDNVNTPIVDLSVNNNSVSIWDEVVFTSNVENILWQNLNSKVSFSWDFDGDGFYDKETTTNSVSYKYESSWEKFAKVKVKYKWFSNTKTVTMNVANVLKPDFDYVSIWNDFVFFDTSLWNATSYLWDMWDGNKITKSWSFTYTYTDWKSNHLVSLKTSEWTKSKETSKKVFKDLWNYIKSKKEWLIVFSNLEINEEDVITIEEKGKNAYFYLWASSWNIVNYVADFDIAYDSDLNWWNDDDEDNKFQDSYISKNAILVELNSSREQVVRLYTKDVSWNLISSRDIKIIKTYVEEAIDINTIIFEWVSESIKFKLEKIKTEVSNFPKEHKLKWLMYVQKLKEEWNDNREKTNIIIEFEWYIEESAIPNSKELIDLLESLLIEWDTDKSEKSIAFNALKNLIPKDIKCIESTASELKEWLTCYDLLVAKLEVIWENSNIDENKELWKMILENIAADEIMTVKEKTDFKAILNTFVYWGVSNIPTEEKEIVVEETTNAEWNSIIDIFIWILKIIFFIILLFSWVILLFFIYYKIVNKDKNISFSQFVSEKTWSKKPKIKQEESFQDILWESPKDIFADEDSFDFDFNKEVPKSDFVEKEEPKIEEPKTWKVSEIPDWLKWSFSEDPVWDLVKEETKVVFEPIKNIPIIEEPKIEEPKTEKVSEIPDWLKWSFSEEVKEELISNEPIIEEPKLETKEELDNFTKIEIDEDEKTSSINNDSNLPDWLKWSFSEEIKEEKSKEEKSKDEDFLNVLIQNNDEDNSKKEKKSTSKKVSKSKEKKSDSESKKDDWLDNNTSNDTELWDDWMKIPDWLKTDDDK